MVSFRPCFEIKNPHNYISSPFLFAFSSSCYCSSRRFAGRALPYCALRTLRLVLLGGVSIEATQPIDRFTHLAFPSSFLIRAIGSFFSLPSLSPSLPLQGSVHNRCILIDQLIDVAGSCFLFLSGFPISRFFCLSVSSVSNSLIVTETEIKIEVFMTVLLSAGLYMIE